MKSFILIAISCFCITILSTTAENNTTNNQIKLKIPNENRTVLESWQTIEKNLKNGVNSMIKMLLPTFMENSASLNLSRECTMNLLHLISGLRNIEPWAMKFLDSSGKIIDGIMINSFSSYGHYDECVDTEVKSTRGGKEGKLMYRGQYCIVDMKPPLPPKQKFFNFHEVLHELKNFSQRNTIVAEAAKFAKGFYFLSLRLGVCTPSGCSVEELDKMAKVLLSKTLLLNTTVSRCEIKEPNHYSGPVIAVIFVFCFAGFLLLLGTIIDIYAHFTKYNYKSKLMKFLIAFSFYTNFRKLVNTEISNDNFSCLSGIRFFSMTWIILAHTYLTTNIQSVHGAMKPYKEVSRDPAFQIIANGYFSVDTFFFMGAMLVCYLTIKHVRIEGKDFSIGLYILKRLWRIVPCYIFVLLFYMYLLPLLGSGPSWHDMNYDLIQACRKNWWTNLLFINNFNDAKNSCMLATWYVACDVQLYIGALLILIPMIRWPRVGIFLSIVGIIASILYSGIKTYIRNFPPTQLLSRPDPEQYLTYATQFYFRPFTHMGPYCIGIIAGYILATRKEMKIPPVVQVVGWCLAIICTVSVTYCTRDWNTGVEPTLWATLLYTSFSKVSWTLGVAWMIVCCATGHGGIINYILSWKVFVLLGRLTYLAYLIHPISQYAVAGSLKTRVQYDHFVVVWFFFGHLCVAYGAAFAASMLIESPFMALEKMLLRRGEKPEENNSWVKRFSIPVDEIKVEKNGDIASIISNGKEENGGIDNQYVVSKL